MRKLLLALTAIFLLGLFSTELSDSDAWWHLATGRYIVTRHRLPVPDPFTYTTASAAPAYPGEERTRRFNLTHEWLSQAVWYLIYRGGGAAAVVLWKALLLALLCGLTGLIATRRTNSWLWGIAAAMAAASLAIEFAHDRPSILSYVFTAACIAIFEHRKQLWLVPPLLLIWANCHGGFFLGWIVCAAYAAEALLRRAPDARRILVVSGIAIAASGINPNGFAVIATILSYRRSAMQATLTEWARADLWGPPYAFDLLLYASALCLAASWRRVRTADWLLFAAFAAAALTAFRNEMLVGLLAPVLIAGYFPWKRRLPVAAWYAAAAVLLVASVAGCVRGSFFQLRAAEWRYPAGAAAFLRDRHISAPLFNTYEYGGYLIWRGARVFIDGRALSETVFQDYRYILGTPPGDARRDRTLARYGVGAIVVNAFEYNSGVLYPLVPALAQPSEAGWKLVYRDPQSMVFLRDVPPGVSVLDKSLIVPHLEAECTLHVERDPAFSLCARTLGDLFLRSGDRERARRALALYLAHPYAGMDDPEARRAYTGLLQH
ncbi:MAG: hypothetical protein P4L56_23020 [Candidatus Sulfopaludibacter sp.]|nr:hypothetical protein [Candidatus Sulfopaludibacter sp.]